MGIPSFPEKIQQFLHTGLNFLPAHFQRRRGVLGPQNVFIILMHMSVLGQRSYRQALLAARNCLSSRRTPLEGLPGRSAFAQARRKLPAAACREMFETIRDTLGEARSRPTNRFYGRRVCAIDGTRMTLPVSDELRDHFGAPCNNQGEAAAPQASLVQLWDVSSNQPIDWELGRWDLSEREAAFRLITSLHPGDLLLADRGYPSFAFFQALSQHGVDFLIRLNTTTVGVAREIQDFLASSLCDQIVTCSPEGNRCRRFPGDEPVRLRLIRDANGRVFATSIEDPDITPDAFSTLYQQRWNIETAFREGKEWRGLEDFIALFVDGIYQEVTAIMVFQYLVGELEIEMHRQILQRVDEGLEDPQALQTCPYTFNRLQIGECAVELMHLVRRGEDIALHWTRMKAEIWRERSRHKRNRSYPRRSKKPRGKWRKGKPYAERDKT